MPLASCFDGERRGPPSIRWAASSNRIYVEGGCATINDIIEYRSDKYGPKGPLYYFDQGINKIVSAYTGTYYLDSNIHITNGATLEIDGDVSSTTGCQVLLLASNPLLVDEDSLNVRAHGGKLVIRDTKIFSWDITAGTYDFNPYDGRAHISALTEIITGREIDTCPGDTRAGEPGYSTGQALYDKGTGILDIFSSEIGYLGYSASESYGISYKARGLCKTLENQDIFDDDQPITYAVYGDIDNSHLHHNWFGHYSFGHQGGRWTNNEVNDNFGYGFDPHDDSDFVEISNNKVYNNGDHGIIASKRCTDIIISNNEVYNNNGNGIMLHRSCDRAKVFDNYSYDNEDAGLALYESSECQVYDNKFYFNRRGIRWSNGANYNDVYDNRIKTDETGDFSIYMYAGQDEPEAEGNDDGHPTKNNVFNNKIWTDSDEAIRMTNADGNDIYKNNFKSGSEATFQLSGNNKLKNNIYPDGFVWNVDETTCFNKKTDVPELGRLLC
eukprot:jgi/Undpi1/11539/HiC_scaffold_30.g13836.m1